MEEYKRLNRIVSLVEKNKAVLDIGTDHCYVPITLFENKITKLIDCSELREKPMQNAIKNIKKKNLEKEINIFKSDGIKDIDISKYDYFIISGIGSKKILNILRQKKIKQDLILNPSNNFFLLRKELRKLKYKIIYEEIVYERGINYLILKAKKTKKPFMMSYKKQVLGPYLMKDNSNFTHNYYIESLQHYKNLYNLSNKKEYKKIYKFFERGLSWKEKNF